MKEKLQLAMVGLDTSHVSVFTRLLNNPDDPHHLPGARVAKGWPGGSPDFELSWSRVERFTEEARQLGVEIRGSIAEAVEGCDGVLLESADGRVHLEQFRQLLPFGLPVFIDKPLACSLADAKEIARLAAENHIPVMSSSSLRFLQGLPELAEKHRGDIGAVELCGPLAFQETQPGYFWYGMHTFEMLFAILGPEFQSLEVQCLEGGDRIAATWPDGVAATVHLKLGKVPFSGTLICGEERISLPSSDSVEEPFYRSLLKEVLRFFQTLEPAVEMDETLGLMAFVEEANRRRAEAEN